MSSDNTSRSTGTGRLGPEVRRTLTIPAFGAVEHRAGARDIIYHLAPSGDPKTTDTPIWRVLLTFGKNNQHATAGLDIHADTMIGRGAGEQESPDIDLNDLGGLEQGVSRNHALFRPTRNSLYLIDMNSTNGTYINSIPLNHGTAAAIHTRDRIAFAGLTCQVEIISSPYNPPEPNAPVATEAEIRAILNPVKPKTGTETIFGVKLELPDRDDP